MTEHPNGLTYAQAGVDIDAGAALVEAIKPLAKATRRPGAEASLGGFGALFDLKAAGYDDPLLVSTTDGVGTKLRIAIETGLHDTIGIDLVAMCVNDLLAQGAETAEGRLGARAARGPGQGLDRLDQGFAGVDVHPGLGVGQAISTLGHRLEASCPGWMPDFMRERVVACRLAASLDYS